MGVHEFVEESRLADPRLPHHGYDLAAAARGLLERLAELIDLRVSPDEARESARQGGLETCASRARSDQLIDGHRLRQALDRRRPERSHLHISLRGAQGHLGHQGHAGSGQLLHAGGQVRGLPHRRVVHVEITADRANHDLPGVQSNADLDVRAMATAEILRVAGDAVLHPQRGVARPHRMVFMGERRAEESHDSVAHDLVDGALVAVHGFHHPLQHGIEEPAGLLGIPIGEQLHRALEVGEHDGHGFSLAFLHGLGAEDLLGEVLRGVGRRRPKPRSRSGPGLDPRRSTASAELHAPLIHEAAGRTREGEREPAVAAKAPTLAILSLTAWTLHAGFSHPWTADRSIRCGKPSLIRGSGQERDGQEHTHLLGGRCPLALHCTRGEVDRKRI